MVTRQSLVWDGQHQEWGFLQVGVKLLWECTVTPEGVKLLGGGCVVRREAGGDFEAV